MAGSDPTAAPWTALDWDLPLTLPEEHSSKIIVSCISGQANLTITGDHTNMLVCALPKSASLYVTQLLAHSFGVANTPVGFNLKEGNLYYPRLLTLKFLDRHSISHCHAAPDPDTLHLIRSLDLRPIVLTRNVLDALVSRRDMLVKDKRAGNLLSAHAMRRFLDLPVEDQMDVVIDLFAPSYINFVAGWDEFRQARDIDPVFATYEELVADEVGFVQRVGERLGFQPAREHVERVIDGIGREGGINLATGISGRGQALLSDEQIDRVRTLARHLGCPNAEFLGVAADPARASRSA
jgi:hypothetical protein